MNPFFFGVIKCRHEKSIIKTSQMVVRRSETSQPSPMGKARRPKRLGDEPFKLSHVPKINGFDSFSCIIALWMPLSLDCAKTRAPILGFNLAAQAPR